MADPHDPRRTFRARFQAGHQAAPKTSENALKFGTVVRKAVLSTVAVATVTLGFGLTQGSASAAAPMAIAAPMTAATPWQVPRLTKMVAEAIHQTTLGISYSFGGGHGSSPAPLNSHVDCSGFIRELYHYAFGTDIGNGSGDGMVRLSGEFTQTSRPVPGDVALFGNSGHAPAYHAGIYVGIIAGHPAIAASPATGSNIKIQQWFDRYWHADLMGYWHYKGATAADSGSLTQPKVVGHFDAATGTPGGFRLSGWSVDPQRKSANAPISVVVDNRLIVRLPTPVARVDVNRAQGATGNHGFNTAIPFAVGRHTLCLSAQPAGTNSAAVSLGCRVITVPGPTRGS